MKIDNQTVRALWLTSHGLTQSPTGPCDPLAIIKGLGFVQLDTIQVVSRAHHHILWSRNQNYRESMLDPLLRDQRQIFEHFTHDASILPMSFLPMWRRQFERKRREVGQSNWFGKHLDASLIKHIMERITIEGPLSTQDFIAKTTANKKMWARPPHKMVLDYLWYAGDLATTYREGFTKFYDLAERVFPEDAPRLTDRQQIHRLCDAAIFRLGFGSLGDIRNFWAACDSAEVSAWAKTRKGELIEVEIEYADKSVAQVYAAHDIYDRIQSLKTPNTRLRILNPFDPAIRDRIRLHRLFGFDYKVEMFVPEAKRKWGYYVYPMLEGHKFVGRIEVKGNRKSGVLTVTNMWFEKERLKTPKRLERIHAELTRFAKLASLDRVEFQMT